MDPRTHSQIINADSYTFNLNSVMFGAYVKLDRLAALVYETYGNSSIAAATQLNVFVDINSIIHPLYSRHNKVMVENVTDISANIINLCGHYRNFFRSQLGVDTRFFLINSTNTCEINRKFVAEYNIDFADKVATTQTLKLISNNMKLLEILCPYLPAIYYVESAEQFETAVIIANLIETLNDGNPNLIISHDMYPLQLCSDYKWTSYLYPKKTRIGNGASEDISWMIPVNDKEVFREAFWGNYCLLRKANLDLFMRISPINYPLVLALAGIPERGLKRLMQNAAIIKFIESIVGGEDIKITLSQLGMDSDLADKYPIAQIESRFKASSVQYMLPFYKNSPEVTNISLLDLNDPGTVNKIISKYYANNPIDLQRL